MNPTLSAEVCYLLVKGNALQYCSLQFISELEKSVSHSDFVDKLHAAQACPHGSSGPDELDAVMGPLGSWTIVDKSDAVDAMASYLAAWLSQTPEAQNLDPLQLQAALLSSLKVYIHS